MMFDTAEPKNGNEIFVSKPIETSECSTIESYKKVKKISIYDTSMM
jgi:hypothetical protein